MATGLGEGKTMNSEPGGELRVNTGQIGYFSFGMATGLEEKLWTQDQEP